MELPTYTGIWRIEKRLYKLYDFRLPMPLPVGQIAVFAAITIPYIVLLTLFGVPLNHDLFWLYVLPPGLLTWLATRPNTTISSFSPSGAIRHQVDGSPM